MQISHPARNAIIHFWKSGTHSPSDYEKFESKLFHMESLIRTHGVDKYIYIMNGSQKQIRLMYEKDGDKYIIDIPYTQELCRYVIACRDGKSMTGKVKYHALNRII